jgi:hypothetical protein
LPNPEKSPSFDPNYFASQSNSFVFIRKRSKPVRESRQGQAK